MNPIYVSPKEIKKDREEFCTEELRNCSPLVALKFQEGILFLTKNTSAAQNKIFEVYDKIALGVVGYAISAENVKNWLVQNLTLHGFKHGKDSVRAKNAVTQLAELIGGNFLDQSRLLIIELVLGEVDDEKVSSIYRISFDGIVTSSNFAVIPKHENTSAILEHLTANFKELLNFKEAFALALNSLRIGSESDLRPEIIEAAVLDTSIKKEDCKFRRLSLKEIEEHFNSVF